MRTKTPFRRKRLISLGSSSSSSVEVKVERELQCSRCKAIFPDYLARCPECGSEEWIGLVEVNPYTRMPMETFLKACGHLLWLVGTTGFLVLLWQTDSPDAETNKLFIYGAFLLLFCSVLFSAAYFGMSENHAPYPPYAAAAPRLPRKLPRRSTRKRPHPRRPAQARRPPRAGLRFAY